MALVQPPLLQQVTALRQSVSQANFKSTDSGVNSLKSLLAIKNPNDPAECAEKIAGFLKELATGTDMTDRRIGAELAAMLRTRSIDSSGISSSGSADTSTGSVSSSSGVSSTSKSSDSGAVKALAALLHKIGEIMVGGIDNAGEIREILDLLGTTNINLPTDLIKTIMEAIEQYVLTKLDGCKTAEDCQNVLDEVKKAVQGSKIQDPGAVISDLIDNPEVDEKIREKTGGQVSMEGILPVDSKSASSKASVYLSRTSDGDDGQQLPGSSGESGDLNLDGKGAYLPGQVPLSPLMSPTSATSPGAVTGIDASSGATAPISGQQNTPQKLASEVIDALRNLNDTDAQLTKGEIQEIADFATKALEEHTKNFGTPKKPTGIALEAIASKLLEKLETKTPSDAAATLKAVTKALPVGQRASFAFLVVEKSASKQVETQQTGIKTEASKKSTSLRVKVTKTAKPKKGSKLGKKKGASSVGGGEDEGEEGGDLSEPEFSFSFTQPFNPDLYRSGYGHPHPSVNEPGKRPSRSLDSSVTTASTIRLNKTSSDLGSVAQLKTLLEADPMIFVTMVNHFLTEKVHDQMAGLLAPSATTFQSPEILAF